MQIIDFIKKFRLGFLFIIVLGVFIGYYSSAYFPNHEKEAKTLQKNFLKQEKRLDNRLKDEVLAYRKNGFLELWSKERKEDIFIHIFQNDSLVYWNTNQLPILRFADIHFPYSGIVHLQNGWYYTKMVDLNETKVCASILIKMDYPYQNKDLQNTFSPLLLKHCASEITLDDGDFKIENGKGEYQFSMLHNDEVEITPSESVILFLLFLSVFVLGCLLFFQWWKDLKLSQQSIFVAIVIVGRILWQMFGASRFLYDLEGFQAQLYASNDFLPNFGAFLLNIITISLVLHMLRRIIDKWPPSPTRRFVLQLTFLSFYLFWSFFLYLNRGMIENSIIPFEINHLFELNTYSLLGIAALGVLFHAGVMLLHKCTKELWQANVKMNRLMLITFVLGALYFLYEINYGDRMLFAALFPFLFLLSTYYITRDVKSKFAFTQALSLFFLFTFCFATNVWVYNERKERDNRELYANQLRSDRDISTEMEFQNVEKKLRDEALIKRFTTKEQRIGSNEFQDRIERRIFTGFWEHYDMDFHLYDDEGITLVSDDVLEKSILDSMISKHGSLSEIDSFSYFIADFIDQYSYVFRMPLVNKNGELVTFYGTFKSKKIPEEIGFPRLLISNQAKVFEKLENYSVAKFHRGRLVNRYGEFNFPTYISALMESPKDSKGYIDYRGYNHLVLKSVGNNYVVLSAQNQHWFDLLTTFSYLFCFLGILILPFLFNLNEFQMGRGTLTLAVKIQLVLIAFVFVSLLMYGWGSGIFVRDQYNSYTNKVISEKLHSVNIEFQTKFGGERTLNIEKDGGKMGYYLKKFSKVFVTDINFYDVDGYIMASSRPKVYNIGLLSEQMNPVAIKEMKINFDSEFTHQETIGKLTYSSAYLPFFGSTGEIVGYLNLQHFGQQKEFETQIQRFLTAIINVFMLLLAVSIVVAIFVSGWLTAPLRILQESFAKVNLGQRNERILYEKDDEIGALVKEYNEKIEELALKAEQLAQSERESAWREMAKQVAHEIKNPLTPMKLGLQHFEHIYDPENPMPKSKLQKVVQSLVEQIDGLTRIANEFSNFAKMPTPNAEKVELLSLIDGVVQLFGRDDFEKVVWHKTTDEISISADKDMLIRIFNNLIKNALQAIQGIDSGKVEIFVTQEEKTLEIEVKDNGKGITESEKQNIFVPYFTTKSAGTGLGLAMVKQMVELHHGTIRFTSEEGKGTSFFVELPF
jgi:signal transduction histidine kinase